MNFRASFCDPFKPDIVELGDIPKEKIMETFDTIPWKDYLQRMKSAENKGEEIYYSPSLEVENKDNKNGLSVSAVDDTTWYIFFKRPKLVKGFLGLTSSIDNDFLTDIEVKRTEEIRECILALSNNDLQFLENRIK